MKAKYNAALKRYYNMVENVPEETLQANPKLVEEVINDCNNLLNKIGDYEVEEILQGFEK